MSTITVKITKNRLQIASVEKFVAGALNYQWAHQLANDIADTYNKKLGLDESMILPDDVRKIIWKYAPYLPENVTVATSLYDPPESRQDRLTEAQGWVNDAVERVGELKTELEDWKDNLDGKFEDKASELEDAISNLEALEGELQAANFDNIEFPGAFGK